MRWLAPHVNRRTRSSAAGGADGQHHRGEDQHRDESRRDLRRGYRVCLKVAGPEAGQQPASQHAEGQQNTRYRAAAQQVRAGAGIAMISTSPNSQLHKAAAAIGTTRGQFRISASRSDRAWWTLPRYARR